GLQMLVDLFVVGLKKTVLLVGLAAAGAYVVQEPSVAPSRPCKPAPVSSMDPQPGLAPWRCMPEGDGPDHIEAGEPRRVYGNGERPAPPRATGSRSPRPAD